MTTAREMRAAAAHRESGASSGLLQAVLTAFTLTAMAPPASAHESRPLFIEIVEEADGTIELKSTAPASIEPDASPLVRLEAPCVERRREKTNALRQRAVYDCAIADAGLAIEWPSFNPSVSTLIRATYVDGDVRTAILDPSSTRWRAPPPDEFSGVSKSYFRIGVHHIFGGVDHLLFLAGLLYLSGGLKRALVTVTGFTFAHSLTLALVALGWVEVSIPATEAVIALSIVFLATEIARGDRTSLAWRRPLLVATAFGLVHGAGFAAALGEVGLPKGETSAALLFFNIGVEAGQLAIVAAAFVTIALARSDILSPLRMRRKNAAPLEEMRRVFAYSLGMLSGYWFIERLAALALA